MPRPAPRPDPRPAGPALPDVSIRQLEYLVAVADSDTWAHAADSVGVSPSALSQGLAELERRVGVPLFDSVGRRRVLRVTAAPVLQHARRVLALTHDLVDWATRIDQGRAGRVRLGLIDVAAVVHFPDVLRRFRHEHPDVELTLSVAPSRTLLEQLANGGLDLAVCVEPPRPVNGVEYEPLLDEDLVVYAPPGESVGPPSQWGPWVLFPAGSHTRTLVEQRLRDAGAPVVVAAESHQPDVIREMVELGVGWTVLPRSQGSDGQSGQRLVDRRLVLARRHGVISDPAADDVAARLRDATSADHAAGSGDRVTDPSHQA